MLQPRLYVASSDFPNAFQSQNRLYVKGTAVNGRIDERESTPVVIIDGHEYTWEAFGQLLTPFNGFNFRLECFDPCEDMETSPKPDRPDPVWWLACDRVEPEDDPRHH